MQALEDSISPMLRQCFVEHEFLVSGVCVHPLSFAHGSRRV